MDPGQGALGRSDEVDRLVRAWSQQRPDLDLSAMEVFSRVSRLAHHLDVARRTAFSDHAVESWEFDVLAALRRAGSPYRLSPGELIRETLVTSGTITNRVDRLLERGLVIRRPAPTDRRGVNVELTATGLRVVDGAITTLLARERALLRELDPGEQSALADLLRRMLTSFEMGATGPD